MGRLLSRVKKKFCRVEGQGKGRGAEGQGFFCPPSLPMPQVALAPPPLRLCSLSPSRASFTSRAPDHPRSPCPPPPRPASSSATSPSRPLTRTSLRSSARLALCASSPFAAAIDALHAPSVPSLAFALSLPLSNPLPSNYQYFHGILTLLTMSARSDPIGLVFDSPPLGSSSPLVLPKPQFLLFFFKLFYYINFHTLSC